MAMSSDLYRAADRIRRKRYPENHGRIGEDLAHRYLQRHGCTVVARNYRPPSGPGEIDLVVWEGGRLGRMQYIPPQVAVRIKRLCGERICVEPLEDAALKARRR